jgi:exonuclease SbcC
MRIKSVKIHNILSIENAEVTFDDDGLMLVEGWNHDVNTANGAGKTAVFNAISFALFGELPRKITATEVLRRGCKSGYVEISVAVGETSYRVKRLRPKGVHFFKEERDITLTQSEWEHILGLNYDQFILSMYAAQGTSTRFLSINDSEKKKFLLQLLNLEEFSSCKVVADGKVKLLEDQLISLRSRKQAVESKIDAYQESLIDENVIQRSVDDCNKVIADMTKLLIQARQVPKPDLSKYLKLEDDMLAKRNEFAAIRVRREILHDSHKKLGAKNSSIPIFLDKCRSCGHSLDIVAAKATYEKELAERSAEMAEIKRAIDDCDSFLGRENGVNEISNKIKARKVTESAEYDAARFQVSDLQTKITLQQRELKEFSLKLQNNSELLNKIKLLRADLNRSSLDESSVLRNIELYKTLSAMYSPTGAQAYILDSVIDSFNERVAEHINLLWSNLTYELKSYKETVKGDVTAKFSEHLLMDGRSISIGSLSGGEYRALSLCVDLALIGVMERQFGLSLSPIILDEPFENLDGVGREFIFALLEKISGDKLIIVIDHSNELKSMFSKVLSVEKRNGISTVNLQV